MRREINMCKIGKQPENCNSKPKREAKGYRESREDNIIVDPNGSYTGVCIDDKYSKPIQDVDDL